MRALAGGVGGGVFSCCFEANGKMLVIYSLTEEYTELISQGSSVITTRYAPLEVGLKHVSNIR